MQHANYNVLLTSPNSIVRNSLGTRHSHAEDLDPRLSEILSHAESRKDSEPDIDTATHKLTHPVP